MNLTTSIHSKVVVSSSNEVTITAVAEGKLPEIYEAEILQEPKTINNTSGVQGDLMISLDKPPADAALTSDGRLVLTVSDGEEDKYRRDGANLMYDRTTEPALNNTMTNVGDQLLVAITCDISGRVSLAEFVDDLTGVSAPADVVRLFQVSADGIFWTEWTELTDAALQALDPITADGALMISIQYIRQGGLDPIEFKSVMFSGAVEPIQFVAPVIDESIFASVASSEQTKRIERNLFKKLYYRGVMAQYVTRGANRDYDEDRDYVSLFSTVGRFFAMMVSFAKRFENIYNDFELLREYVRQIGLYFDEKSVTLEELQYLASHYYDEIRQRGTAMVFARRGENRPYNGEFVRLFGIEDSDELLTANLPVSAMGWCLGKSSPLYRGVGDSNQLNKTRETSPDFEALDDFVTTGNVSIEETADKYIVGYDRETKAPIYKNKVCLKITEQGGLGRGDATTPVDDRVYTADCNLSYEVSFWMKSNGKGTLNFGVEGFNIFKTALNTGFIRLDSTQVTDYFANELPLSSLKANTWYHVRGIIHAYSTKPITVNAPGLNIAPHLGTQLCYNNYSVEYILPKIQLSGADSAAVLYIWDYKIRPLVYGRNILPLKETLRVDARSNGFIQSQRLFYIFLKNNNNSMSQAQLEQIVNKYLIPYGFQPVFVYGTTPVNTSTTPSEFTPYLVLTPNSIIINASGNPALVDLKTNTNVIKVE